LVYVFKPLILKLHKTLPRLRSTEIFRVAVINFVERLIESFRIDSERLLKSLEQQMCNHDYNGVRDSAHALRGGSASVGATHLVQIASRLENASHGTLRARGLILSEEVSRAVELALASLAKHIDERQRRSHS